MEIDNLARERDGYIKTVLAAVTANYASLNTEISPEQCVEKAYHIVLMCWDKILEDRKEHGLL